MGGKEDMELFDYLERLDKKLWRSEKRRSKRFATASQRDRTLLLVNHFNFSALSGGLGPFLQSAAGLLYWAETIDALKAVGARKPAKLLTKACRSLPGGAPKKSERARHKQVQAVEDKLDELTEALYALDREAIDWLEDYWEATGGHSG